MCLKLVFHHLDCDVRPRVARSIHNSPIVNPYAAPNPCPQDCHGREHIAPYFRCLKHKCCMTSAEYVYTGCTSRCSPDKTTDYHVYTQWLGSAPRKQGLSLPAVISPDGKTNNAAADVEIQQWEPSPTIDSYIPKLRIAVPTTPAFRQWRTDLLAKGSQVQQVLELMDLVETRLAEELQHQQTEHHICQRLHADWQKYRRFPDERRPDKCRNKENIEKFWKKLTQLSVFLKAAEIALERSKGHDPSARGVPFLDNDADITHSKAENLGRNDVYCAGKEEPDLTCAIIARIALQAGIMRADLLNELDGMAG